MMKKTPILFRDTMMDIYASSAMAAMGHALAQQRGARLQKNVQQVADAREVPSMDSIYESSHWTAVKQEEQRRGDDKWGAAQQPWATGTVPTPAYSGMFAAAPVQSDPLSTDRVKTMAGTEVSVDQFTHTNMQPYFRGSIKQNVDAGATGPMLEKFTGSGGMAPQPKREVQCFFEPTTGYAHVHGMQDNSQHYMSRLQVPISRNNEFPVEQVRVGKGLGLGYTAAPAGGFQQASTREYALPKTVDELRPTSRPKQSYKLPVQSTGSGPSQRGMMGRMEKQRPDTFYEQTPDMLLRTTGSVTKPSARPIFSVKPTARVDGNVHHVGTAQATGAQPGVGASDDYGRSAITIYDNERQATVTKTVVSNLTSVVKAAVAPVLDVLRRTPKEYAVDAPRVFGSLQSQAPAKPTTYDPVTHCMRTTIKETLVHDTTIMNPKGATQHTVPVMDSAKVTVRETLPVEDQVRNVAAQTYMVSVYNPDAAKKTIRETLAASGSMYGFVGGPVNEASGAYTHVDVQVPATQKQLTSDYQYSGGAGSKTDFRPTDRDAAAAAQVNGTRERANTAAGYTPNAAGTFKAVNGDMVGVTCSKPVHDSIAERAAPNPTRVMQQSAMPVDACQITKPPVMLNANENRLDPKTLTALKNNPYALSITPSTN